MQGVAQFLLVAETHSKVAARPRPIAVPPAGDPAAASPHHHLLGRPAEEGILPRHDQAHAAARGDLLRLRQLPRCRPIARLTIGLIQFMFALFQNTMLSLTKIY